MENFKDLKDKYESHKNVIIDMEKDLYRLCNYLKDVANNYIDGEDLSGYNPFVFGYDEKLVSCEFTEHGVDIHLQWLDPYEGYDSNSRLQISKEILDKWVFGDYEGITNKVLSICRINKHSREKSEIKNLEKLAETMGYKVVKEEGLEYD